MIENRPRLVASSPPPRAPRSSLLLRVREIVGIDALYFVGRSRRNADAIVDHQLFEFFSVDEDNLGVHLAYVPPAREFSLANRVTISESGFHNA